MTTISLDSIMSQPSIFASSTIKSEERIDVEDEINVADDRDTIPVLTAENHIDFSGIFSAVNGLSTTTTTKKLDINSDNNNPNNNTALKTNDSSPNKLMKSNKFGKKESKKNLNLSSEVWNHFSMGTEGLSVMCKYCNRKMKRTDSSTKSMWGHLRSFHTQDVGPEVFERKRNRRVFPKRTNGSTTINGATTTGAEASIASITSLLSGGSGSNLPFDVDGVSAPKRKRYRTKRILDDQSQPETMIGSNGVDDEFNVNASGMAAHLFLLSQLPSTSDANFNNYFNCDPNMSIEAEVLRQQNCASHESHQSGGSLEDATNVHSNNTTTTSSSASPFNANDLDSNTNNNSLLQNCVAALMLNSGLAALADGTDFSGQDKLNLMEELLKQFGGMQSLPQQLDVQNENTTGSNFGNETTSFVDTIVSSCNGIKNEYGKSSINEEIADKSDSDTTTKAVVDDTKVGKKISLSDRESIFAMHEIARDLDLTYSFYSRNGQPRYRFEPSHLAENNATSGRAILLTEQSGKVHITECLNGCQNAEVWAKTDLTQLMWAIRGKCQKSLRE